jgi:hypothetical protein
MADSEDGLDIFLALADDPEGCQRADVQNPIAQRMGTPTAALDVAVEDETDIFCRMADEADDALVPGSPGAADVPFDTDDDDPLHDPQPGTVLSDAPTSQPERRLRSDAGSSLAPRPSTSAVANGQQKGELSGGRCSGS